MSLFCAIFSYEQIPGFRIHEKLQIWGAPVGIDCHQPPTVQSDNQDDLFHRQCKTLPDAVNLTREYPEEQIGWECVQFRPQTELDHIHHDFHPNTMSVICYHRHCKNLHGYIYFLGLPSSSRKLEKKTLGTFLSVTNKSQHLSPLPLLGRQPFSGPTSLLPQIS